MAKVLNKAVIGWVIFTGLLILGTHAPQTQAQSKWWWETYPSQVDKTLSLKGASGGSVSTKQNPTGANAGVTTNAATQPPTVIIQQTASASTPNMTCVHLGQAAGIPGSTSLGNAAVFTEVCPQIPGYQAYTFQGRGSNSNFQTMGGGNSQYATLACCYVPTPTIVGGASYSPWTANNAFASNGYTGTQKQEFVTVGTYSFVVPGNVFRLWITVVGGGAGGGGGAGAMWSDSYGGSGGGGGRGGIIYRQPLDVIPGEQLSVRVGRGGAGGGVDTNSPKRGFPGARGQASYVKSRTNVIESQGGGSGGGGPVYAASSWGGYAYSEQTQAGEYVNITSGASSASCTSNCSQGVGGNPGHSGYGNIGSVAANNGAGSGYGGSGALFGSSSSPGYGNSYNPTGYGLAGDRGPFSQGGGGGGAAGFLGMAYSTSVPSGTAGAGVSYATCIAYGGQGGYGYGAGGGGASGVVGTTDCRSAVTGNGGQGADGAVWIEW